MINLYGVIFCDVDLIGGKISVYNNLHIQGDIYYESED
nr:MAG TPA: hypothetical protein [Caudoviricetes sp.]